MKILVAGDCFPWPETTGTRMRLANIVSSLATLGDVDFITLFSPEPEQEDPDTSGDLPVARAKVLKRPSPGYAGIRRLVWFAAGRVPNELYGRNWEGVRRRFREWSSKDYDLIWFSGFESGFVFGNRWAGAKVLDADSLEDQRIRARLRTMMSEKTGLKPREWLHRRAVTLQGRRNERLWRSLQRELASRVDVIVTCSEFERRQLNVANAVLIENGYEAPLSPKGRVEVGSPPTILLQGLLTYPPNADAARFLVETIGPHLWAKIPELQIRLVGQVNDHVRRLADPPRVVVTGFVPDIDNELAAADLVALPLRYGAGTRIKILEAFAHRLPVVSTTFGAEGIDVVPGQHLLTADDPEGFAASCVELLTNTKVRASLVDDAHRLFLGRYQWSQIRSKFAELASSIVYDRAVSIQP